MSDTKVTGELRTDLNCEVTGIPAEKWGEAVFKIGDEELVMEISIEDTTIVALMAGEEAVWKGSFEGLKLLLKGEIKGR